MVHIKVDGGLSNSPALENCKLLAIKGNLCYCPRAVQGQWALVSWKEFAPWETHTYSKWSLHFSPSFIWFQVLISGLLVQEATDLMLNWTKCDLLVFTEQNLWELQIASGHIFGGAGQAGHPRSPISSFWANQPFHPSLKGCLAVTLTQIRGCTIRWQGPRLSSGWGHAWPPLWRGSPGRGTGDQFSAWVRGRSAFSLSLALVTTAAVHSKSKRLHEKAHHNFPRNGVH